VVYHCAALANDWGPLGDFQRTNVEGTQCVLDAASATRIKKFVHVSTEAVLLDGSPLVQVTESRPLPEQPLLGYPSTKAEAERRVLAANDKDLATVIVRPRLIWGKDDPKLLPRLVEASDGGWLKLIDRGQHLTSTCHVDNVVEGLLLAAERGLPGRTYFLTDGEPVQVHWFMAQMLEAVGRRPPSGSIPYGLAKLAAKVLDFVWRTFKLQGSPPISLMAVMLAGQEITLGDKRARQELGYQGAMSIEQGLAGLTGPADLPKPPSGK
jgi:nucleoside-diphosphate-sugar epimerase